MDPSSSDPDRSLPSAERAFERLSDDEALRGSLEDEGYGALLEVLAYVAPVVVEKFDSTAALGQALRDLMAGAVSAAQRGDRSEVITAAGKLLTDDQIETLSRRLPQLESNANANARTIARSLAIGTGVLDQTSLGQTA